MGKWLRGLPLGFGVLTALFGALVAWGEADPLAAVIETRSATLLCGVLAMLLALPFRSRLRIAVAAAGAVLIVMAASWYATYQTIPVSFASDVRLSGTLYRPRSVARPPVYLYLHGSGRATRREGRHIAQLLVRHGFASLIYDKRGSGESGGSLYGAGYDGYARDAAAAIRFAASRPDLDPSRIVVQAQSEAEWVLAVALQSAPPVRAIVATSCSIMRPSQQVLYETAGQLRIRGYPEHTVERAVSLQRRVLEYQRTGVVSPGLAGDLSRATSEPWFEAAELPDRLWPIAEYRWWRQVMDFDAQPYWQRVHVPVLALSGALDPKTDGRNSQRRLRELLAAGGNRDFTGHLFPRAEHGMIEWCGGRFLPPCWPSGFPEVLLSWLDQKVAKAPVTPLESEASARRE